MSRYVALLRGVNVAGKNLLPMKELAALFVAAGCTGVKTYIQSGNVVFAATPKIAERIPKVIAQRIAEQFGLQVPVVVRSAEEWAAAIRNNPFLPGESEDALHVYFLADPPHPDHVDKLDANRSHPDRFTLSNREVYLHLPNGMGRTKLTNAYFDSKLKTVSTARNWRTVLKLHEMLGEP